MRRTLSSRQSGRKDAAGTSPVAPEPSRAARTDAGSRLISFLCVAALAWATLLLCDVARGAADAPDTGWPLLIDRLLAVPVELTDVSDLRAYAIPVCLALLLLVMVFVSGGAVASWFEGLAAVILLAAVGSAIWNDTWEISRGYLFFLACYAGWAVALSWVIRRACIRTIFAGGSILAAVAVVLSLWHLYALGARFFQLPVGPITVTAAFGALWASMAIAWVIGGRFAPARLEPNERAAPPAAGGVSTVGLLWAMVVAALSLWLAWEAARRGAFLALLVSVAFTGGLVIWVRYPGRPTRVGILAAAVLLVVAGGYYVRQQSVSPERVVSVPLQIRYTYWTKALEMAAERPLSGYGPDLFICEMTTALARQRAEMPQILHGGVDFDAHNEWIQAVFELGVPGGLLYLALPLVVIALAVRSWIRTHDAMRRAALLACIAGLVDIVVAESSSVNLRHPMLASWYWTLLGVTVGLIRSHDAAPHAAARNASGAVAGGLGRGIVLRPALFAAGAAMIVVVAMDLRAAMAHARGRALMQQDESAAVVELESAIGRFGAARWLSAHTYLAHSLTAQVRRAKHAADGAQGVDAKPAETAASDAAMESVPDAATESLARRAVDTWERIHDRAAGYLDTGFRLAEAQMLSGDTTLALSTLREFLTHVNPYDRQANSLLIAIGDLSASQTLDVVLRTLRSDRWDALLITRASAAWSEAEAVAAWPARVAVARSDVTMEDAEAWQEPLAPEILRIEAFRLLETGDLKGAAEAQHLAALVYQGLADRNERYRRLPAPEADAWYLSARFLFDLDASRYKEAYRRIVVSERFAVQGILTERVRKPSAGAPYVGGQLMPLEAPERLRDIWRFSAMMYLSVMGDPQQITLRITWSLPPERHAPAAIQAELGILATELVQRFGPLPENRRPANFPRLVELAQQYGPRS